MTSIQILNILDGKSATLSYAVLSAEAGAAVSKALLMRENKVSHQGLAKLYQHGLC